MSAIETFGGELVVAKGAEELADEDVGLLGGVPHAHVRLDDGHDAAPWRRLVLAPQRHERVRVLLDGVHAHRHVRRRGSPERAVHERPAARAHDHHDDRQRVACRAEVRERGLRRLLVAPVLDGVLLEDLVRRALEVVAERLQRHLQHVKVRLLKLLERGRRRALRNRVPHRRHVRAHAAPGRVAVGVSVVRAAGEHELRVHGAHHHAQERLVAAAEHRQARGVGQEQRRRQHDGAARLGAPARELRVALGQVRRELEHDAEPAAAVAHQPHRVPRLPRVVLLLSCFFAGGARSTAAADAHAQPECRAGRRARGAHDLVDKVRVVRAAPCVGRRGQQQRGQRQVLRPVHLLPEHVRRVRAHPALRRVERVHHPRRQLAHHQVRPVPARQHHVRPRPRLVAPRRALGPRHAHVPPVPRVAQRRTHKVKAVLVRKLSVESQKKKKVRLVFLFLCVFVARDCVMKRC